MDTPSVRQRQKADKQTKIQTKTQTNRHTEKETHRWLEPECSNFFKDEKTTFKAKSENNFYWRIKNEKGRGKIKTSFSLQNNF